MLQSLIVRHLFVYSCEYFGATKSGGRHSPNFSYLYQFKEIPNNAFSQLRFLEIRDTGIRKFCINLDQKKVRQILWSVIRLKVPNCQLITNIGGNCAAALMPLMFICAKLAVARADPPLTFRPRRQSAGRKCASQLVLFHFSNDNVTFLIFVLLHLV